MTMTLKFLSEVNLLIYRDILRLTRQKGEESLPRPQQREEGAASLSLAHYGGHRSGEMDTY
jgi:hypothetical protein